ncbi:MAG TPA: type II toxin-antitoxin system HicA family toxin [Ignavibacteria bacterium]|nr:type II toxin-antitoxin system HicA family toxin [Ignavibacteria bacterium]HMQ99243.1 type II toxin-antitoxin system HicA family toxin [Ignavibacteria bacterium]
MPKLPILSGKEIIKILNKFGFTEIRQKGSHVILKKYAESKEIGCVVPLHKEVAIGTLRGILKQANIAPAEFITNQ